MILRSPAPRSVGLAAGVITAPIVGIAVAAAASKGFDAVSVVVVGVLVVGVGAAIALVGRTAAFVLIDADQVVCGLSPFWRTRVSVERVRQVRPVDVDGVVAWTGAGIRGRLRGQHGRLYSVGGSHGIMVVADDGRCVTVALQRREDVRAVVRAIEERRRGRGDCPR